jgi:competence ComEA-like helix-hairpin-helix protein
MSQRINYFHRVFLAGFLVVFLAVVSFGVLAAPININTADAETLATELTGIGATKAAAIVAYRESHGLFKSLDDLVNIKGIGAKTLEKNRANLVIGADNDSQ